MEDDSEMGVSHTEDSTIPRASRGSSLSAAIRSMVCSSFSPLKTSRRVLNRSPVPPFPPFSDFSDSSVTANFGSIPAVVGKKKGASAGFLTVSSGRFRSRNSRNRTSAHHLSCGPRANRSVPAVPLDPLVPRGKSMVGRGAAGGGWLTAGASMQTGWAGSRDSSTSE